MPSAAKMLSASSLTSSSILAYKFKVFAAIVSQQEQVHIELALVPFLSNLRFLRC